MRPFANRSLSRNPLPRRRGTAVLPGLLTALLLVASVVSCTLPGASTRVAAPPAPAGVAVPAPRASWSVAEGAEIPAGGVLRLDVADGVVGGFEVTGTDGRPLPVTLDGSRASAADLPPVSTLSATASVTGADGATSRTTRTVRTGAPPRSLRATVTPGDDATVGVGQPIVVTFNSAVADRAAAERALSVTADRPVGEAGWYWFNDTQVQYRPKDYWPTGTKVTVRAALSGVRTGAKTWGVKDTTSTFTIGRSQILRIDAKAHSMAVIRDGADIRTVPVSLGQHKGTWETRSGIKTVMSVQRTERMDSSTVGITGADAYDKEVPYAMRLTWSGEFIHGAPWSEWAQGKQDVSHGCTNVSLAHGKWLFENSLVGDPVETVGTSRTMEEGNGWGGGWNVSWDDWKAGSALA